jgi:hypothetical protein
MTETASPPLDEVRSSIEAAFDGAPPPDEDHYTLYQAEAWDTYEICDRSRDHLGRWQEIPVGDFAACTGALAHLDAQGIRYYLPALMLLYLERYNRAGRLDILFDSLEFTLTPSRAPSSESAADLRDYQRRRLALLDPAQRRAIYEFVAYVDEHDDLGSGWLRSGEARRAWARAASEGSDWYERFQQTAR